MKSNTKIHIYFQIVLYFSKNIFISACKHFGKNNGAVPTTDTAPSYITSVIVQCITQAT